MYIYPECAFLGVIGTKTLRLLLHSIYSHLHQLILHPRYGFLELENSTATDESGWSLVLLTLSLCLPLKVALFFLLLNLFLYIKHMFPIETIFINAIKGGNLAENHTTPMVSEIYTKLSINEENSSLSMKSIL